VDSLRKILTTDEIRSEIALALGQRIIDHTQIIYYFDKKGKASPVSSAVALKCRDKHFLVTAAHTLKEFEEHPLGIIPGNRWVELSGEHVLSDPGTIEGDKMDVAIFSLNKHLVEKIGSSLSFYDLTHFNPDHIDYTDQTYMVVGYPLTKIKINPRTRNRHLAPLLFISDVSLNRQLFENQGFTQLTHQLFNYRKRRISEHLNGTPVQGPSPKGLSGCGIWKFSDLLVNTVDEVEYYPTSIVIEYIPDYSMLAATRINVITETMRLNLDADVLPSLFLDITSWI
jgi:hypothetical protein